jgi:hypothetical protein
VIAPSPRLPRALTAIACAGLLSSACLAAAGPASASGRADLAGTHPGWAVQSRSVAAPDATTRVSAWVYLAGRDPAGLTAYAAAVSQPGGRLYLPAHSDS